MPIRSLESRWPSMTTEARGSCWSLRAMSSRQALCSLLIRAELNGKKIGPQGTIGLIGGGGATPTPTVVVQLLPGQASPQWVLSVATLTVTVIVPPPAPVVSSDTSDPLVDERVPPVVDQL